MIRQGRRLLTAPRITYVALAGTDTWLAGRPEQHRRRAWTKPLLMPVLAYAVRTDPAADSSSLRRTTLLAELGGWGGDVALLRSGSTAFLMGMGSFGAGHVATLVGLLRHRSRGSWTQANGVRAAGAAWLVGAPALAELARRRDAKLGLPVLAYASLLAATVAAASHLDPSLPADVRRLTACGAWVFLASDAALAVRTFALEESPPWLDRGVMATYTLAQLLLAEGALRVRPA